MPSTRRGRPATPSCAPALLFRSHSAHRGHAFVISHGVANILNERVALHQVYLAAHMALKEQALARLTPSDTTPGRYTPTDDVLAFLDGL